MRLSTFGAAIAAASIAASPAPAAEPDGRFDPRAFRASLRGEPTQLLVLGTPHLSGEDGFDPEWLDPVLDRLEAYAPEAIAIEALSGESLRLLSEYESIYPELAATFGRSTLMLADIAQASLGIDMATAEAAARQALAGWSGEPAPSDRRRLAVLFLASGDPHSALVQWLRLPEAERREGEGLTGELAERLNRLSASRNERVAIAVRLAVRLGLERVHPIDDQSEADLILSAMDEFVEAEQSPATAQARARFPTMAFTPMASAETVLRNYREQNSDEAGARDAAFQWRSRLDVEPHREMHRRRIASWETRNLRMAAHVREVSAYHPGGRVLVVVGAAHKPYLEAYLSLMSDADLVPAAEILE